jgi:transcriptional regulator with XRE-family HTH domain
MPQRSLGNLGALVRTKRGDAKLRETARQIGIGPATLLRVESGRIPDVTTFGKICKWLGVDPGSFLGFEPSQERGMIEEYQPLLVSAHLKVDQTPNPATANALAKMIILAAQSQRATEEIPENGNA